MKIGTLQLPHRPVILAPLEDITDPPYRIICKRMGADLVYTEFISSDGLVRDAGKSKKKLDLQAGERPVGIQIFGNNKEAMVEAAQLATEAGPDLIDINWGCPVKKVAMKGAGSGILLNIPLMVEITAAVVKATPLPVTVKTRLGWDDSSKPIVEVAEKLQDAGIAAITIHGRTRAQLYSGKADWTLIAAVKNNPRITIPVIGNGDITGPESALEAFGRFGVDGIMIGRAAVGNPWIFSQIKAALHDGFQAVIPTLDQKLDVCKEHLLNEIEWKGERQALNEMRKFYGGYFSSLPGIKAFRSELVTATSVTHVMHILDRMRENFHSQG